MTTTVTTVTSATATTLGIGAATGLILTVVLIALLISRELVTTSNASRVQGWHKASLVAIVPLLLSFMLIVGAKLAAI